MFVFMISTIDSFNSWLRPIFVDRCYLLLLIFVYASVFAEDLNSWGRAVHEYHGNWATTNSNDITIICPKIIFQINLHDALFKTGTAITTENATSFTTTNSIESRHCKYSVMHLKIMKDLESFFLAFTTTCNIQLHVNKTFSANIYCLWFFSKEEYDTV